MFFVSEKVIILIMNALLILLSNSLFAYYSIINDSNIGFIVLTFIFESLFISIFTYFRIKKIEKFSVDGIKVGGSQIRKEETSSKKQAGSFLFAILFVYPIAGLFTAIFLFSEKTKHLGLSYEHDDYIFVFILGFFLTALFRYFHDIKKDIGKEVLIGNLFTAGIARPFVLNPLLIFGPILAIFLNKEFESSTVLILLFFIAKIIVADLPTLGMKCYKENKK